ncbi:hypothetical protein PGT21_036770 [Puccinia graminis f. sp. tritici]|uniref:Uncharacterized protein n=1 Tax=Puccinia graminis f. sp. tritici TaxID=56615 RepID=A0A5B0P3H1_PUCGR|nr:hypothetical protein PGT21_036770 [Puccinia graminis f. sp. tritici]
MRVTKPNWSERAMHPSKENTKKVADDWNQHTDPTITPHQTFIHHTAWCKECRDLIADRICSAIVDQSSGFIPPPKLALPFKPLSSNHLAHLRPTTLFLDLFFSLQRPLLEIELGPIERRSISFESKQSKLESEADLEVSASSVEDSQDDLDYPHFSSGVELLSCQAVGSWLKGWCFEGCLQVGSG